MSQSDEILREMLSRQCPSTELDADGSSVYRFDLCCDGRMNIRAILPATGDIVIIDHWFESAAVLSERSHDA